MIPRVIYLFIYYDAHTVFLNSNNVALVATHYAKLIHTCNETTRYDDLEITPRWKAMADQVAKLFGGLDIFSIDLLALADGSEVILEVNDTYTGLFTHATEDRMEIVDLIMSRLPSFAFDCE